MTDQSTFLYVMYHLPSAGFIALCFGVVCIGVSMHYRRLGDRRAEILSAISAVLLLILGYKVYVLQTQWNMFVDAGTTGKPPSVSWVLAVYTTFALTALGVTVLFMHKVLPTRHIRVMGGAILATLACVVNELWISSGHVALVFLQVLFELPILAVAIMSAYNASPMSRSRKLPTDVTAKDSVHNR